MKFIFRGTTLFTYDPDTKMVRFTARKEYVEFNLRLFNYNTINGITMREEH